MMPDAELTAPPFDGGRVDPKPTVVLAGDADSFLQRQAGGRDAFANGDAHPALGHEGGGHTRCPVPSGYLADLDRNRQLPPRRERVLDRVPFLLEATQSRKDWDELLNRADPGEPARGVGCCARHRDAEREGRPRWPARYLVMSAPGSHMRQRASRASVARRFPVRHPPRRQPSRAQDRRSTAPSAR